MSRCDDRRYGRVIDDVEEDSQPAVFSGNLDGLTAGAYAQLPQNLRDPVANGPLAEPQAFGYFGGAKPLRARAKNLLLSTRQRAGSCSKRSLGSPRMYDFTVELFFLGRRRSSYQALVVAAGIRPGQRVLDVGCGTGYFARAITGAVGSRGLL